MTIETETPKAVSFGLTAAALHNACVAAANLAVPCDFEPDTAQHEAWLKAYNDARVRLAQ